MRCCAGPTERQCPGHRLVATERAGWPGFDTTASPVRLDIAPRDPSVLAALRQLRARINPSQRTSGQRWCACLGHALASSGSSPCAPCARRLGGQVRLDPRDDAFADVTGQELVAEWREVAVIGIDLLRYTGVDAGEVDEVGADVTCHA